MKKTKKQFKVKGIGELQAEMDKCKGKWMGIQDKINTIREKEALPELRKMFVGKCFRYNNSGGAGRRWFLYWRVLDVTQVWFIGDNARSVRVKLFMFETYPDDYDKKATIFKISQEYDFPLDSLGVLISEKEFEAAWKASINNLSKMWMPRGEQHG